MIQLHAFFSNGLIEFARVYLESFKLHHGEEIPILFDTRDLERREIHELHDLYGNLTVRNRALDFKRLAELSTLDEQTLRRMKDEIEHEVTTDENFRWKLLMSVEERYMQLLALCQEQRAAGFTKLVHTDIDSYFRGPITGIGDMLDEYDVVMPIRNKKRGLFKKNRKTGRIWGCLIGLALEAPSERFLTEWHRRMVEVPFPEKPRGFGQLSLYAAYAACRNDVRFGNLYADRRAPGLCKIYDDMTEDSEAVAATIWAGNSNAGRNRKDLSAQRFRTDMHAENSP